MYIQYIIVIAILLFAIGYVVRSLWRTFRCTHNRCEGCDGCSLHKKVK
ncbi:MAG: FeoB-associated Cys-rich membrane protein [Prevotellaceae bacterium]|nr:FeoB-associated Cys-rich membrane protein [Prevotella sp.]MDD7273761.1 FeoB-associated Cys-rich membrane protein [Prevotellaceae bacterium]MDY4217502.1 FeoB-associated Cys-rich membrane protein [Prevotella sp.]